MGELRIQLGDRSYRIIVLENALDQVGVSLKELGLSKKCILVTNSKVGGLYSQGVLKSLSSQGFHVKKITLEDGEEAKSLHTLEMLYREFLDFGIDRGSAILALGGGVVGDVTGFAASTYMRGLPFIQLPTTLLAQVDSSVGGKVGVNHPRGKNLIGAFYQPVLVAADLAALETLPSREVLTGMAEIIKCGFIADKQLVSELEAAAFSDVSSLVSSDMLIRWVKAACDLKARVVAADAKEMGYREILNFGHTVGHGVEKTAGYGRYTHGEAVAIGMVTAAILSYRRGYLSDADCRRIISLIDRWGLPTGMDSLSISEVVQACRFDKKVRSGRLRFVLLESVGKARAGEIVDEEELADALKIQAGGGLW